MGGDISEDVAKGLANIYFNPQGGLTVIKKILPLLQ
jgi:hypothetical protein